MGDSRIVISVIVGILFLGTFSLIQVDAHFPDVSLTGFGTPTIDGVLSPGEWDGAGQISVFTGASAGSTFFVMNDADNLYLALEVVDSTLTSGDIMEVRFDNAHNGVATDGDDNILARQTGLVDVRFFIGGSRARKASSAPGWWPTWGSAIRSVRASAPSSPTRPRN